MALFALAMLVLQNLFLAVVSRYARLSQDDSEQWISTTVVCCSEASKLIASAILIYVERYASEIAPATEGSMGVKSWSLMAVPGLLYCAQNNLYFIGVSNLSVSLFQVLAQMKILTTAFFAVTILRKALSLDKWLSLVALTVGVMLIVSNGDTTSKGNMFLGVVACGAGCCTSGLAGVFLEMMLKNYSATVWERNFQMATYGLAFGIVAVIANDREEVQRRGFFSGYSLAVLCVIALQAGGGLVVAVVLKYADNLMKCFAVALSVLLGCVMSRVLYGEGPSLSDPAFMGGTILVCGATVVYSMGIEALLQQLFVPDPKAATELELKAKALAEVQGKAATLDLESDTAKLLPEEAPLDAK